MLEFGRPLKLLCYFQNCFQNSKKAVATADTAAVAVYYVTTALKVLKSCSVRVLTPLKIVMLFPKMFSKL